MTDYVLAADGGNSKTDLVLASADGSVLARIAGAGTRPHVDGFQMTADRLATLARAARDEAGLGPDTTIAAASLLLANVDVPDEEISMRSALGTHRLAEQVEIGNDTLAVLRAGSARGWGIAVVCGAGINAVGQHADGRLERFLGLGAVSGDWGGGWGVGIAGIGAAVRAGDGRGPATVLRRRVTEVFGTDPESVAVAAHRNEIAETELLGFAPIVFAAAADGDAVATTLVERLADEVLDYVRALVDRMSLATADVDVVLGGSALQAQNPVLMARLTARLPRLAHAARLVVLDVPPVVGAVSSALRRVGAGDAAIAKARATLRGVAEA